MAQHQDLKRKGGADPDHQMSRNHAPPPPPLSIEVPKIRDLPNKSNPWSDVQLPVDILLLTVEDCEFLACYTFLENSFKSYDQTLGYVYFGTMGESGQEALKVALMRCYKGSSGPGGSQNVIKNAVMKLRPKVAFCVGECIGLKSKDTKLGDVVVSSKLSTEEFTTPVRRNIGNLNLFSTEGWNPPLKDPVGEETVQVHRDSVIFSGSQFITKQHLMSQSHVIAVEREGEGLFAAAHDMNIEWVIVKGISHFSDDSNTSDESWKSFASIMAASLVSNMLNDPVVFKEWPHYEDLTAKNQSETTTKPDRQIPDAVCLEECQKQLRSLYETSSKVKIIPWDQNSAVHIDKIYTDLSWVMDDRTPRGVIQENLVHYTEIFAHRKPRSAPKRILVYGQPGIGKTVFTKKATFDWSQQSYSETLGAFDLVLLVRLRDVSNLQDVPSILRACEVLDSNGAISVHNLYDYVCRHQEKVLLILDGYDEYVYNSKKESPVFKIWKKSQLRDCCVVITSREMKAETLRICSDAQFKIDGFNDQRQKEFARRFLKDDKDIEDFFMYLRQHNLSELAQIPLLLLMLCLLWTKTTRKALPKERAHIFAQFVKTLFDHLREKQSAESVVKDYSDELYALGRLAFEALLQGQLYFPFSQLPAGYSSIERLIEVGLFQVLNMASLNPEKGVYFIHKSVQEYLAGNFLKEELTSKKAEGTNSLSKVDSVEKIFKINEALKFAVELSEEAARDILIQLGIAATKEELTEFRFDNETPSQKDLSEEQTDFINLCNQLFFYCSAETRKNLFPTFLSSLGGVLVISAEQLNVIVQEKLVQTTETHNYVFFNENSFLNRYTEQDYSNLIILAQQLNAVIVSSAGEKKASEFLGNLTWRRIDEFFLKKENNTHLYLAKIVKYEEEGIPFPWDIIVALISKQETRKKTNMNGDESSEESSISCCSKRHGLSRVWEIEAHGVNRSGVELMIEMMPFITAPHVIKVGGEDGEMYDAEVTESLLRSIQVTEVTHKLEKLRLCGTNVTSSPAVEFINNVFKKAPNLELLDMSFNPLLGVGVDSLIKHLSCAPHLKRLKLQQVKMTPQQVKDLSSAIKQHSNITTLVSSYHDRKGNPKPERKWPSEEDWKSWYPSLFSQSSNESQPQKQQIPAETRLSIHDSPIPADDQDTVETFPAPRDPVGADPMLAMPSIPTAHGSSHGLTPAATYSGTLLYNVQYPQHYSSPDIYTYHHSAPSTILTPGGSLGYDSHLFRGSDLSTVTWDEPESKTRPSAEDMPSLDPGTAGPVPVPLHSAGAPIPASHFSSHSLAPFSGPSWQPRSTFPGYPYPRCSGISTVALPPVHPGYLPLRGMQDPSQQRVQSQNTMPRDLNLEGSAVTYPQEILGFVPPHGMQGARIHGLQPQNTISDDPYFIAPGVSTHTHSTVNLGSLLRHETLRSPQYGFHFQSYPHLQFSGPISTSSVTNPPVILGYSYPYGNRMTAPLQALQPQSANRGDSYISGPITSSFMHPPVIPGYSYSYGNRMVAPLQAPQPQSASPGDSFISGPITSSVTHPAVDPGYSYPYGNRMRAPLQAPQSQSASPVDSYISGPVMSSVTHRPVTPGFLSPRGKLSSPLSGMQRGSSEVQHERNPSTESDTQSSQ